MANAIKIILIFVLVMLVLLVCIACDVFEVGFINKIGFAVHKVDDATNYKTIKEVENTCRAMIASYESDKLTYEQYNNSENEEKLEWAEQAKMRANKTVSTYNNYILENNFVWKGNVPKDINTRLDYLE